MGEGTSITLMGDLSKPATALIEKIADATGALLQPWQIKRVAKAEAEAAKTKALADIEITDIQRRAMYRLMQEETLKQKNIEEITQKSFQDINDDAKPESIENDWISNFFDKCKFVSDDEMQNVWAQILAGEANHPGTFSKRTIELMSQLDKSDAELFRNLCSYCWMFGNSITALIFKHDDEIYTNLGINFSTLSHLEDIGLIKFASLAGFARKGFDKYMQVFYYGTPITIEFRNDDNNSIDIGQVMLTKIGEELAPISKPSPQNDFFDYIIQKWHNNGFVLSMPINTQSRR